MNCWETHRRLFYTSQQLWEICGFKYLKWYKRYVKHLCEGSWIKHRNRSGSRFGHQSVKDYTGVLVHEPDVEVNYILSLFKKIHSLCMEFQVWLQCSQGSLFYLLPHWLGGCVWTVMGTWMPTTPVAVYIYKSTLCDLAHRESRTINSSALACLVPNQYT